LDRQHITQDERRFIPLVGRHLIPFLPAALVLAGMVAITPAMADAVPLPRPGPKAHDAAEAAPPLVLAGKTSAAAIPDPIIPDPRNRPTASFFTTFDAKQKAEAAKASTYLSSLHTLVGNFVQVGPDGSRTTGELYLQRPGRIRFEYDAPSQISIIADGKSVVVRDRKLATQDVYPLSQTPLRFLLADRIDLMRDTKVVAVTDNDLYTSITLEEQNPMVGTSRVMLMFSTKDNQLKQWTVTDPQGYDTTVAIYNLDTTKKPDPGMFKIDYTNYSTPNN
jgi:outer membrane lipoprotein-sorting protein